MHKVLSVLVLATSLVGLPVARAQAAPPALVFKTPSATLTCAPIKTSKKVSIYRCASKSLEAAVQADGVDVGAQFAYRGPMRKWRTYNRFSGIVVAVDSMCGEGCSPISAGTDVTVSSGGTISLPTTLTQSYTFSGAATFSSTVALNGVTTASSQISAQSSAQTACPGSGTPIANAAGPICLGPIGGTIGLVIGKASGTAWAGTTASNSSQIMFIRNTGSADSSCPIFLTSGGSMQIGCVITSASNNITAGTAFVTSDGFQNAGANGWNGTCASVNASFQCVTGTLPTYNVAPTGLTCYEHDTTNNATAAQTGISLTSGSTFTFTKAIPNGFVGSTSTAPTATDTALWWCWK